MLLQVQSSFLFQVRFKQTVGGRMNKFITNKTKLTVLCNFGISIRIRSTKVYVISQVGGSLRIFEILDEKSTN